MGIMTKQEIPIDEFNTWIAALRSGEYKQGRGCLQSEDGYCCLGVACKALIPEDKLELNDDGFLNAGYPLSQPNAPEWLKNINVDFSKKAGRSLDVLNDCEGFTFDEIADVLEAVYVHGVMEKEGSEL